MTTAGIFRALAFVNCRGVSRNQRVEFSETIGDGAAVETGDQLTSVGVDIVDVTDVAIVDLFIVIVLDLHDLVAGREGPAEALTFRSPAGLSAACSSMLSERAPTPPRFIGHSTWMSRMGSSPKRWGMRVFASSMIRGTAVSGSSA